MSLIPWIKLMVVGLMKESLSVWLMQSNYDTKASGDISCGPLNIVGATTLRTTDLKQVSISNSTGIDIFRILSLCAENRGVDGKTYLDEKYQIYCKLVESSDVLTKRMRDKLIPVDLSTKDSIPSPSPNSSLSGREDAI